MPTHPRGANPEDNVSAVLALANKSPSELTLQDKLQILFVTVRARKDEDPQAWRLARRNGATTHHSGRPVYTNTYVCKRIAEEFGVAIQPDYLGKLRNGSEITRNIDILTALADFFKVDPGFLAPARTTHACDMVDRIRANLLDSLTNRELQHELLVAGLHAVGLRTVAPEQISQESTDEQVAAALAQWLLQRSNTHNGQDRGPIQP